jgi:hypothetical protein
MQRVNVEKKRPTPWPWVAGAAILALIVWGVTSLLAAPQGEDDQVVTATATDTMAPAALPAPPNPVMRSSAETLDALPPLSEEHVGLTVQAEGEVVATGTTGFWMVAASQILRVDSERPVRKAQTITVDGTIEHADDERTEQIVAEVVSRNPQAEGWRVVRSVKLVDRNGAEPTTD